MIKLIDIIKTTPGLEYHLKHKLPISENIYRYSSEAFVNLFGEARELWKTGMLELPLPDVELLETTDIGKWEIYEGRRVPLDLPLMEDSISEAEYRGRNVDLNKPSRSSGPKKYQVYVKNDKGNVIKVNFGDQTGGLSAKIADSSARQAFSARHNCKDKKDKTKPGYWACRLPRYWKSLGGNQNYSGYW